ncbi:MAG: putative bifunctional diguanylate cyclase/phosphodiesterase [Acidimicrobiales bacterium]
MPRTKHSRSRAVGPPAGVDVASALGTTPPGSQSVLFDRAVRSVVGEPAHMALSLREAIDHENLLVYYQPEVDLRTGALLGVEALVRWNHQEHGVLDAGTFVAVAEEAGLMAEIDSWVLGAACRQMATWREASPTVDFVMRVNMSPSEPSFRDIAGLIKPCLSKTGLPGQLFCFEITERVIVEDVAQAVRACESLRALGVSLAIDDFGTGYNSMLQLQRFPVDALKIDRAFVSGLGTGGGDRAVVEAAMHLGRSHGLDVIAEGVDSVEAVRELLSLGCHRGQGFLLSRPMPPEDLESILSVGGIDPAQFSSNPASCLPGMELSDFGPASPVEVSPG